MNKTVTINISGIIFHIEEDAFEKLSKYLSTIRGYFKDTDGRDEIMTDIESRIAEILQEKVNTVKQVVLMNDVNEVIAVMGKPEEFAGEGAEEKQGEPAEPHATYEQYTGTKRRRVFRDPDNKVLGGVCGGIAAYFDIDALWLRIAWAVSFFVFGFGFLLYILLWIIIPKANTTAEKLEMKGEKVNINNIHKTINEELEDLKKKVNNFKNEATSSETRTRVKSASDRFIDFLTSVFGSLIKVVGKVGAGFILIISSIILVAILAMFFNAKNAIQINENGRHFSFTFDELAQFFFVDQGQQTMATIGLALLICVPLIMAIYHMIRYLLNIKTRHRIVGVTASILWIAGLIISVIPAVGIAKEFSAVSKVRENLPLMQPTGNTLYIQTNDTEDHFNDEEEHNFNIDNIDAKEGKLFIDNPQLDIVKSETDSFQLYIIKNAHGLSKKEAFVRAQRIDYSFTQNDSVVIFNNAYGINIEDKWRNQDVKIIIKVPVNKSIYLSRNLKSIIYDVDNIRNTWDYEMLGRRWIMTADGLDCVDCAGLFKHH